MVGCLRSMYIGRQSVCRSGTSSPSAACVNFVVFPSMPSLENQQFMPSRRQNGWQIGFCAFQMGALYDQFPMIGYRSAEVVVSYPVQPARGCFLMLPACRNRKISNRPKVADSMPPRVSVDFLCDQRSLIVGCLRKWFALPNESSLRARIGSAIIPLIDRSLRLAATSSLPE